MGNRVFRDAAIDTAAIPPKGTSFMKWDGSVDIPLLLIMIAFVTFGLVMVYSASWDYSLVWYDDPMYQFQRQILWVILGIVIATVISFVDYHNWRKYALAVMAATISFLFVGLIINKTTDVNNNIFTRAFFGGSIQPSELAKAVTIIYLSVWLHSKREQLHELQWGLLPLGVIIGIISGLIFIQPDLSAAMTIFMLGGLLFFLGGGDMKQIILLLIVAIVMGVAVVTITSTGQARMDDYLMGIRDLTKASDHVVYSFESIVNGEFFGVGIGRANTKLTGLPFAPTDSIFAVIAEEFGLLGVAGTVLLYGLLVWRGLRIANRAPDMLGSLLASGLTFWIGFEALINMLVMVGLLPFAGNTLPFISYGGSSMVSCLFGIGILMSISRHIEPETEAGEWRNFGASLDLRGRNRRRSLSRISRS